MTKKENLLRTIKRDNPLWVPYRYDGSLTFLYPDIISSKIEGGLDDWGTTWLPTKDREGCYPDNTQLMDINLIDKFEIPKTNFKHITLNLKKQIENSKNKDTLFIGYNDFVLFERCQLLLGMEKFFIGLALDLGKIEILMDKIIFYQKLLTKSMMESGISGIRFLDDWGMQNSMFINPSLWRKIIKPRMQLLYNIVKESSGIVFHHSCGHIEEIIPDLIEIGVDVIDPCQPASNNIYDLKNKYGNKITFMGGINTQSYLTFGTPMEVKNIIMDLLIIMSKGGGYIAAPSHTIAIPACNKKAMIEAIGEFNREYFKKYI